MSRWINRFRRIPPSQCLQFLEACLWILLVRLSLALLPFRWLFRFNERLTITNSKRATGRVGRTEVMVGQCRLAIARAARVLPFTSTCLCQAYAGRLMLFLRGIESEVTIGVKGPDFQAHAWLESGGLPVAGVGLSEGYTVISRLC